MIQTKNFTYDSRDGMTKIHAMQWEPAEEALVDGKPVCIVQIVHGMTEHIGRYDDFAGFLADKGILVVGNDHLGHGESLSSNGLYGYFCENDPATVVVRDVHRLKKLTQENNPGVPYIILAHSMGSYILRNYLVKYGTGIDGAILLGTGFVSKPSVNAAVMIPKLFCLLGKGKSYIDFFHKAVFGKYLSRIDNPQTQKDWLTKDRAIIEQYLADQKCQFNFTVNGYYTLSILVKRAQDEKAWEKIPKKLPILIAAGTQDPVGNWGEGPQKLYDAFINLDMTRTQLKLYNGDRHEILNEVDRETVYVDLYNWIQGVLDRIAV